MAEAFWEWAGPPGPFPRRMRAALPRALPLTVEERPGLRLREVLLWLAERGVRLPAELTEGQHDRPLHACLACHGRGHFLFLEKEDGPAEQRFSLAHEAAHFLRDYLWPRLEAERRLGAGALAVFDGERPATTAERIQFLLRNVSVAAHVHLLARDGRGAPTGPEAEAERCADRLAYELLAPADVVLPEDVGAVELERRLEEECGLPAEHARRYARMLRPPAAPVDPLLARLFGAG
jgi:hypothetical protein